MKHYWIIETSLAIRTRTLTSIENELAQNGVPVFRPPARTRGLSDVATGWTECIPIIVREAEMVVHALGRARELFPFPLRGV